MTKVETIMAQMHKRMAEHLLDRLTSGEMTAAELNVARQFLKDNGIDAAPKEGEPITNLAMSLPFSEGDGYAN